MQTFKSFTESIDLELDGLDHTVRVKIEAVAMEDTDGELQVVDLLYKLPKDLTDSDVAQARAQIDEWAREVVWVF
jgi:oligoribonuclease (3'-5' exoribonuclease)